MFKYSDYAALPVKSEVLKYESSNIRISVCVCAGGVKYETVNVQTFNISYYVAGGITQPGGSEL